MVRVAAGLLVAAVALVMLTGCRTEYHGSQSGVDGVFWRQIDAVKQPLFADFAYLNPHVAEQTFVDEMTAAEWDGHSDPAALDVKAGRLVTYNLTQTVSRMTFGVLISSGPRPDVPTDSGQTYSGPSQIYTCFGYTAKFNHGAVSIDRVQVYDSSKCPPKLVKQLPDDAAFADLHVFDG